MSIQRATRKVMIAWGAGPADHEAVVHVTIDPEKYGARRTTVEIPYITFKCFTPDDARRIGMPVGNFSFDGNMIINVHPDLMAAVNACLDELGVPARAIPNERSSNA